MHMWPQVNPEGREAGSGKRSLPEEADGWTGPWGMSRRASQLGRKHQGHGHEKVGAEHKQSIIVQQDSVKIKNDGNAEATWKTLMK